MSIAAAISSPGSVTTQVRMRLACQGLDLIVNQLGPAFAIVTAPSQVAPCTALLTVFVDTDRFEQTVELPEGIKPGQTRVRLIPVTHVTQT
jgi:hypothetical protein